MNIAGFEVGLDQPFLLIAGPDTLESTDLCQEVAGHLAEVTRRLGIAYVFKGSFDKANRTSVKSYRGPGIDEGLKMLEAVRE
ncbi:MAG: 3-deoxy-8-phosphooctulonate synthase, partial [Wenzhouxiangellaceae bacterium]